MEKWKYTRRLLMLLAMLIFIYQTYSALTKYFESPTVIINSETTLDKIQKPRIFLDEDFKLSFPPAGL